MATTKTVTANIPGLGKVTIPASSVASLPAGSTVSSSSSSSSTAAKTSAPAATTTASKSTTSASPVSSMVSNIASGVSSLYNNASKAVGSVLGNSNATSASPVAQVANKAVTQTNTGGNVPTPTYTAPASVAQMPTANTAAPSTVANNASNYASQIAQLKSVADAQTLWANAKAAGADANTLTAIHNQADLIRGYTTNADGTPLNTTQVQIQGVAPNPTDNYIQQTDITAPNKFDNMLSNTQQQSLLNSAMNPQQVTTPNPYANIDTSSKVTQANLDATMQQMFDAQAPYLASQKATIDKKLADNIQALKTNAEAQGLTNTDYVNTEIQKLNDGAQQEYDAVVADVKNAATQSAMQFLNAGVTESANQEQAYQGRVGLDQSAYKNNIAAGTLANSVLGTVGGLSNDYTGNQIKQNSNNIAATDTMGQLTGKVYNSQTGQYEDTLANQKYQSDSTGKMADGTQTSAERAQTGQQTGQYTDANGNTSYTVAQKTYQLQVQQLALDTAIQMSQTVGYVTAETSKLTGVPVGTTTAQMQMSKNQIAAQIQMNNADNVTSTNNSIRSADATVKAASYRSATEQATLDAIAQQTAAIKSVADIQTKFGGNADTANLINDMNQTYTTTQDKLTRDRISAQGYAAMNMSSSDFAKKYPGIDQSSVAKWAADAKITKPANYDLITNPDKLTSVQKVTGQYTSSNYTPGAWSNSTPSNGKEVNYDQALKNLEATYQYDKANQALADKPDYGMGAQTGIPNTGRYSDMTALEKDYALQREALKMQYQQ